MKRLFALLAAASLGGAALPYVADAQLTDAMQMSPYCTSAVSTVTFPWSDCRGSFAGNNAGSSSNDVIAYVNQTWNLGATSGSTTNEGSGSGPFSAWGDDVSAGTLNFDNPISGEFVLALKASNSFSLYYFENADGLTSVDFSTLGTSVNKKGKAQGLSHATLYVGGGGVSVPEPGMLLLLGTGLLGMVTTRRRREGETA